MTKYSFTKYGFIGFKHVTFPHVTFPQVIAKVFANFASSNSGNYGRFFTVSFSINTFHSNNFHEFKRVLSLCYDQGGLQLGVWYSILFRVQLNEGGYEELNLVEYFNFSSLNDQSYAELEILFYKIYDQLLLEFFDEYYCNRVVLCFFPFPTQPINTKNLLVKNKGLCQQRSYFTSTKVNSMDKDKWLRDGYLLEEAAKESAKESGKDFKDSKEGKVEEKPLKIIINDIIFNKLNESLWIDYSPDVDYKKAYESIELVLSDLQKTDSRGFLNDTNLNNFPIISNFINYFVYDEEGKEKFVKGNKVTESYKWIFNVLMTCLYEYSLKVIYNMEQNSELESESESDFMVNFKTLSKDIYSRIDPSVRIKLQKRGITVVQNIYTGFDTEFKYIKPGYNDLISVQLAVNTKSLLKIPKYCKYELCSIDTLTGEEYKIDISGEKNFRYLMVEETLNRSIKEIRSLKYKNNDVSISILIEGLQRLNIPFIEKEDVFVFSFPRTPIQPFIYYNNEGKGYSIEDMIKQSILIGEPYLKEDYEKLIDLLKSISSLKLFDNGEGGNNDFNWRERVKNKILDAIKTETTETSGGETAIEVKKMTRTFHSSFTEDKVSVTKIRNNYIIAHWTVPDLPMFNDFETLKEELVDIVNNSFVTLGRPRVFKILKDAPAMVHEDIPEGEVTKGKPVEIGNTNVIIRDTMLLAPQGHKSLESIGRLYGKDFEKINLTKEQKENMDLLLKENKKLFDSYAIQDAIIPLIHANYMEDFNFKLNAVGIPITLSSLGSTYVKYIWKQMGYKGYQLSQKYLLGDTSAIQTPKGLFTTSTTGLKLGYYIANYKGGRNESFMYGADTKIKTIDYDLTSAYTTAMAGLGNPNYKKGRVLSVKQLEKMSFNEILYSYIIMKAKFKFKQKTKYPSIPANIDEEVSVYPLEGESIINGAEYLLAKYQKCDLKISDIYYIPFEKEKEGKLINQPFKRVMDEIQRKRRQYPKGTIENLTYKEIGNSIYGNVGRGISNKKKYDAKTGTNIRMEAGDLANPIIVSWTTAYIRSIIGECLENISKLKGKVVSVTTDGFITDIENLELKIIGRKTSFINKIKCLENILQNDENFVRRNIILKDEFKALNLKLDDEIKYFDLSSDLINKFKTLNSKLLNEFINIRSKLNWEGDNSLLKEYEKIRLELSGDPSGLEIKKGVLNNEKGVISIAKGIISITTRVQWGKESGIKAATGFQSKYYSLEEINDKFKEILKEEDKWFEFIQFSLRSALDIYKHGGHCTPVYKDRTFRLHYDNKRLIILPKEYENTIDFSNILLESNPLPNTEKGKILRFLSKYYKQRIYNKQTSLLTDNKYKSYTELAVRNFVKGLLSDPPKYNLNKDWQSYSEIIEFVREFDSNIKISKDSISKLKNRKMIFKTVPRNKETLKFVEYVKTKYKFFNENEFFKKS